MTDYMMNQHTRIKLALTLVTLLLVAGPSIAAAKGLYAGGSYGWFKGKDDEFDDDQSNGWRAFIGGTANQIIGWEVGYAEADQFRGRTLGNVDVTAWDASLLAGFPIGPVTPFARVGAVWNDVKTSNSGSDSDWRYKYGVGLDLNLGKTFALRFEGNRTKVDTSVLKTDIDSASVGLLVRFGP